MYTKYILRLLWFIINHTASLHDWNFVWLRLLGYCNILFSTNTSYPCSRPTCIVSNQTDKCLFQLIWTFCFNSSQQTLCIHYLYEIDSNKHTHNYHFFAQPSLTFSGSIVFGPQRDVSLMHPRVNWKLSFAIFKRNPLPNMPTHLICKQNRYSSLRKIYPSSHCFAFAQLKDQLQIGYAHSALLLLTSNSPERTKPTKLL